MKKKKRAGGDIISNVILVGRGRGRGREWVINVQMNMLVAKNPAGTLQMSWVCSIEACNVIFGYLSAKLTVKPVT